MNPEWILYGLLGIPVIMVVVALLRRVARGRSNRLLFGAVAVFAVAALIQSESKLWHAPPSFAEEHLPKARADQLYVGSGACRKCHPGEYETWHASFHRTMTQQASPVSVVAPFEGQRLSRHGQETRIWTEDGQFFAEMDDPQFTMQVSVAGGDIRQVTAPRVTREIVMTTGSHEMQAYWYVSDDSGELWQFPWRYHISEKLWMHRDDVFLQPPSDRPATGHQVWNGKCLHCHSVAAQPGLDRQSGRFQDTRVAELGISCEACHGPARQHIDRHSNPIRRYEAHLASAEADGTIFHPATAGQQLSSELCGSCHSQQDYHPAEAPGELPHHLTRGREYLPGTSYEAIARWLTPEDESVFVDGDESIHVTRFWSDGACRSGGREFSGMKDSACWKEGTMTCLSCHAMHGDDPDDQLRPGMRGDAACLSCHTEYADDLAAHTHHPAESDGSRCMNCHMPYSSYALLKGIRSHRIDIPRVAAFGENVRLNACNLCHLDQTQQWTADALHDWYGTPKQRLPDPPIAASLQWMFQGDAGQRMLSVWHAGWEPAQNASAVEHFPAYLKQLLQDPYSAVRFNAERSLRSLLPEMAADRPDKLARGVWNPETPSIWTDTPVRQRAAEHRPEQLPPADSDAIREFMHRRKDRPMVVVE